MCPGFSGGKLDQTLSDTDSNFQLFLEFFDNSILDGSFQRFGGKALPKNESLKKDDFVMVIFQTQKKRCFGIVMDIPSKHSVQVKILQKKTIGDNTEYTHKNEVFSTKQVVLIYRKQNKK